MIANLRNALKPRTARTRRILYAAELGDTYSHLASFRRVAILLNAQGYSCIFAARDVTEARALVGTEGFRILQAPRLPPGIRVSARRMPVSFAEVLGKIGFLDETALQAVVQAWCELFSLVNPDLVVVNHSPSALLAARATGVPHVLFGSPFWAPPRISPMPSLFPRLKVPGTRFAESDHAVLKVVNNVLTGVGAAFSLGTLADILGLARQNFLCTLRELDPYQNRQDGHYYCGPSLPEDDGAPLEWPSPSGPHILVKLGPQHPETRRLLDDLVKLEDSSVIVSAPGARARMAAPRNADKRPPNRL